MSLTKREKEFCGYYATCRNGREAAARAGFAFPEHSGMRLLDRECIRLEIERLMKEKQGFMTAADGLRRIAFGSVVDAVRLVLGEPALDPELLDLFMVSEIKRTEKGVELKFFDRIKALEALADVDSESCGADTSQFVEAIFKGASAIGKDRGDEDEF